MPFSAEIACAGGPIPVESEFSKPAGKTGPDAVKGSLNKSPHSPAARPELAPGPLFWGKTLKNWGKTSPNGERGQPISRTDVLESRETLNAARRLSPV